MKRGRPKVSPNQYARDTALTDKYPSLPQRPAELNQEGPRNNREQQAWDAWIASASLAIRTTCYREGRPAEPYEIPVIDTAGLEGEPRRGDW